jgi:hypothetical protein
MTATHTHAAPSRTSRFLAWGRRRRYWLVLGLGIVIGSCATAAGQDTAAFAPIVQSEVMSI